MVRRRRRFPKHSECRLQTDLHDLEPDEDGGYGDGRLAEEQHEVADAVDGGHAQCVPCHDAEGLLCRLAETVAVNGCGKREWYRLCTP